MREVKDMSVYFDRRQRNVEIFEDTLRQIDESEFLSSSVEASIRNTKVFESSDYPKLDDREFTPNISVTKSRTFEAAINLHKKYSDNQNQTVQKYIAHPSGR